ncbi:hypothetical protein PPYR_10219 [Photinus pyralis]|uniref:cyclin-dependent kinase n=1 Tax=Photinus pyralis TaxID=7054 RepID=A0A5N4AG04_PHOPY|nr:hypothetical protein PPYR_10219 [Photinus pyralis]
MYCTVDKSHTSGAPATQARNAKDDMVDDEEWKNLGVGLPSGVTMREKKSGALSRMQKLKKRLSHSFGRLTVSKEDPEDHVSGKLPYNGYSDEFLDRLEPNGNIPEGKADLKYTDWNTVRGHNNRVVKRQLSVSSDSKLLDDDIREEARVILRPRKPPRPKSEVLLNNPGSEHRRTKRFSAFGGDSPFGKSEAYIKLEQLGEGSYATVYKGYSNLKNQVVALKEIRLQEEEGAPFTAIREASLLKELKHANIVTLHDIVHTRETLTFVFEYVVLGTPGEEDWPGVTTLPGYKPHKLGQYRPRKLGLYWPRLHDVVQGEAMATALLQLDPAHRLGADDAMCHPYFNGLPKKLLELPDDVSIFSVEGVHLYPEHYTAIK